jgi:ectoine hydroxylase-related dioxygenase (phytanoyl-CoA dioxygenase family)
MTIHASSTAGLNSIYSLASDQIRSYQENGHILLRGVASREEVQWFRPRIKEVVERAALQKDSQKRIEDYTRLFFQVTNIWRLDDKVRDIVFSRRFARIAAELMGVKGVRLYHDQALFKPAGGKPTPWHQDQFYWPLDTPNTITMWMPMIDLTEEMGTMLFANGSHKGGPLLQQSISEEAGADFERLVKERAFPVRTYALNAGDATFHAGWTVHSAHPNMSGIMREVLTVIYYEDGARIVEPDTDFRKVDMEVFHPGQKPGEAAASPLNPLLYDR